MDEKKFCVYEIKNLINSKCYIGKTYDPVCRWKDHRNEAKRGTNVLLYNGMRKYGVENFIFTILETFETENEALTRENFLVITRNTLTPNGYNATLGGGGTSGYKHTPESRAKISVSAKRKRQPMTSEQKKKLSVINLNRLPTSLATRFKLSDRSKGHFVSAETRKKISLGNRGQKRSLKIRQEMSVRSKEKFAGPEGYRMREAIRLACKKRKGMKYNKLKKESLVLNLIEKSDFI